MANSEPGISKSNKIGFSIDVRLIILALVVIIIGMLAAWKPWGSSTADDRTVTVIGEATVKAAPDEYVFYPNYQFVGTDKEAALKQLAEKSDSVVAALKGLGVEDSKIKTNSSGYDFPVYYKEPGSSEDITYTLQLVITTDNKELAQKVQDYLISTAPTGAVSPQASFSENRRKELENTARDEATKDARQKADQSASNLGFKVGKVKTITDGTGFGTIVPMEARGMAATDAAAPESLGIQPGENDLRYSVTVVYFIK